ncbi:hypothetical protein VTN02DRAFT_174 [Thermoascus thermophilus]
MDCLCILATEPQDGIDLWPLRATDETCSRSDSACAAPPARYSTNERATRGPVIGFKRPSCSSSNEASGRLAG